jgi:hypothetical protein
MGGVRGFSIAVVSASAVLVCSCTTADTSTSSLADYVQRECAITVDFNDRFGHLTRDFADKFGDQTALAATVRDIAILYEEVIAKAEELGDPPNGEGVGGEEEVEQAARSLVGELHAVASDIESASTEDDVRAAINRMNNAIVESANAAAEWKNEHPTPELDSLKKAHAGCSDEPA